MHLKVKDQVLVLTGKDKGKKGAVLSVDVETSRAVVERVNMVKKHSRGNPRKGVQGGIVEREAAIQVSNLMVVCPSCSAPTRVKRQHPAGGSLVRACGRCGAHLS